MHRNRKCPTCSNEKRSPESSCRSTATSLQNFSGGGLWDAEMIAEVKKAEGSVQSIDRVPDDLEAIYRTAWEIPMKSLIEMAADRGAFIDQSQSLNCVHGSADYRKAVFHVHARLGEGPENYLLPA